MMSDLDMEYDEESVFPDEDISHDDLDNPEALMDESDAWSGSNETFDSSEESEESEASQASQASQPLEAYANDDDDDDNSSGSTGESSEDEDLFDSLRIADTAAEEERDSQVVQLEDGLWGSLPLELVGKILVRLPPAAHFRFRCVCKRWRSLLTSPEWLDHDADAQPRPACTLMCPLGSRSGSFFCHSERKWFKLPLCLNDTPGEEWELVDTDGGLVCYYWRGGSLLCVCNPLTGSSQVIPASFPWDLEEQKREYELVKLHVDRQTKSFKVFAVVSSSYPPTTLMYDSRTSLWSDCGSIPWENFHLYHFFVWKNVMYTRCPKPEILLAFSVESGLWSEVATELPWHPMTEYFIVSHNDNVLLVQIKATAEECMSVWKLRDEAPDFSRSSWMEVPLHVPSALKPLLRSFKTCAYQGDWIFFTNDNTDRWVKYTFATKSWQVMPCSPAGRTLQRWLDWEPRLDVNVESGPLPNSDQSIVECNQRWREWWGADIDWGDMARAVGV